MLSQDANLVLEFIRSQAFLNPKKGSDIKPLKALRRLDFQSLLLTLETLAQPEGSAANIYVYTNWINGTQQKDAPLFAAWFNLGVQMAAAGDSANAITCYRNALALKADLYQASINLGLTLERLGRADEALAVWEAALQPVEARTGLLNHQGRMLEEHKQFLPAEQKLYTSLLTNPNQPDAIQHWLHLRQKMCKWPVFEQIVPGLTEDSMKKSMGALAALAVIDDIKDQSDLVARWIEQKVPAAPVRLAPVKGYPEHRKIRLGYLSSDYCMHPVSYLVTELFERHNRDEFEVYGYCSTIDDKSPVRQRVLNAFDKWTSVLQMSDPETAQVIRNDEIDILIDLNGVTKGTRLGALRWRPAPVQLTYLGYIGAIPLPELDYMICDEFVVPPEVANQYHPKPLYLPGSYQVNDSKLPVAAPMTRAQVGLPEDKFVFCCFCNNYKITEEIFGGWMQILRQTPNSVLWLMSDNEWSRTNMLMTAVKAGVSPDRLIFAGRVEPSQYLSQLRLADLFLDSYPYNAGTTASDALRMGLPLITLSGQSFVARMAGSLLSAVGLKQGVVYTLADYVSLACSLAANPDQYKSYRQALDAGSWAETIGNVEKVTKNLEDMYRSILVRG